MNVEKFKVVRNQLLLKPVTKSEQKTASGIIIPGVKKNEKLERAKVVGVGYAVNNELVENNLDPLTDKDEVVYDITYCLEITLDTAPGVREIFVVIDYAHVKFII